MTGAKPKSQAAHIAEQMRRTTPARIAVGRTGERPLTSSWLQFRQDHALARDAVKSEFSDEFLKKVVALGYPLIQSNAVDKQDFIAFPPKGKSTAAGTIESLQRNYPQGRLLQIVISDGLSAKAVEANFGDVLPMILDGLQLENISCGQPIVVRYGRVAIADQLTHALDSKLALHLIGERPGLSAADSLSAYLTLNAGPNTISSDRTVVSNIHSRGTLPVEAGAYIVQLVKRILQHQVSGVKLQQIG
jgi:ethanolamine ammonia-lyase small subunit